jgi:hypothetical protein
MREGGRWRPWIRCNLVRISIENFSLDLMDAVKFVLCCWARSRMSLCWILCRSSWNQFLTSFLICFFLLRVFVFSTIAQTYYLLPVLSLLVLPASPDLLRFCGEDRCSLLDSLDFSTEHLGPAPAHFLVSRIGCAGQSSIRFFISCSSSHQDDRPMETLWAPVFLFCRTRFPADRSSCSSSSSLCSARLGLAPS